jgi:peptidoglycan/xylan/chitin deacetylase (PgdA/CDA1 family)
MRRTVFAAQPTRKESPRRGVPVLIYHNVSAEAKKPGQNVISMERFKEQMGYLHDAGYTAVGVSDLLRYLTGDSLPEKSVVLTFDDGLKSPVRIHVLKNEAQNLTVS